MAYIEGNTGKWEYVIGLEVHAQISSKAKLFSGAATEFGAEPNSQVSLVDAAMPGMLPVLNRYCVEQAIKTGLGINGKINKVSVFDRKNYFYADLPQGYQISQFYIPIVEHGHLFVKTEEGEQKRIRINRIHLEQDAGKSMHDQSPNFSLVDLNRSGVALMEIVTEPDLSSPFEAAEYVKKLRSLVRSIGSCDGNMDEGSLRCDANISVRKAGAPLGTRCEIKNVNSVKNIVKAIEYEAMRQVEILESGGKIDQETRLFDAGNGTTRTMRTKEDANDYRYFPDPDLLPVHVDDELIERLRSELPELPDAKIERYVSEFGLSQYDAEVIVADDDTAKYFEEASAGTNPKLVANWISSELFGRLNKADMELSDCKVTPGMIRELVMLIEDGTISGKMAKTVFEDMFECGDSPAKIVKDKGLVQVSDKGSLEPIIDKIIAANPDSVAGYKSGKEKLFGFFVGQVMKETGGKASPQMVNDLLKEKLAR
jgi:aspartyl-tRNA(Asn)/glutamyl-tRNA(Gln) amidotransferase subunit B